MTIVVRMPADVFAQSVKRLRAQPALVLESVPGVHHGPGRDEYFVNRVGEETPLFRGAEGPLTARISLCAAEQRDLPLRDWLASAARPTEHPALELGVFAEGGFKGARLTGEAVEPVDRLVLPGPGMLSWPADPPADGVDALITSLETDTFLASEEYSRFVGTFLEPKAAWRVHDSRFFLAGVGRTGARLAASLSDEAGAALTLADPDVIEQHNWRAMGLRPSSVGKSKAVEVRDRLAAALPPSSAARIRALATSAEAEESRFAMAECDVVITAPDHNLARLTVALAAALYLRPHLDIGTGVFQDAGGWRSGADVRLMLPGQGCLVCVGGLRDLGRPRDGDWRGERAGSLRSLNEAAANLGLLRLLRLYDHAVGQSVWDHLRVDGDGSVWIWPMDARPAARCPVCALAGRGDEGLEILCRDDGLLRRPPRPPRRNRRHRRATPWF
jgi:hypothetical protein